MYLCYCTLFTFFHYEPMAPAERRHLLMPGRQVRFKRKIAYYTYVYNELFMRNYFLLRFANHQIINVKVFFN